MMKLPSVKSLLIRALSNTTNRAPIALKIWVLVVLSNIQ
jgi:hypothetical protein